MQTVFMFPGQGAQQVGMGRDLAKNIAEVADLYRQANEIVGYDLSELCFAGPQERLNETEFSQPGLFVTSVACLKALQMGRIGPGWAQVPPDACLGLSLGEYTALYAAGALGFEEGLKLVQLRGRSMQEAARERKGAMVSILGLDEGAIEQLCRKVLEKVTTEEDGQEPLLVPVNFNCPGQIVVSGTLNACQVAEELAPDFGAIRAMPLKVAGAFHTQMMAPAAEQLALALSQCRFSTFSCKVVANVDGCVYNGPEKIADKLLQQLVSAVRWQQSIEYLLDQGANRFVEIGPGRVLRGLGKKICRVRKQKVDFININGLKEH